MNINNILFMVLTLKTCLNFNNFIPTEPKVFIYICYSIKEEEEKESEDFPVGKNLSMILEASKERNSSASSGIISTVTSAIKTEQPSTIDFGKTFDINTKYVIATFCRKCSKKKKKT